MRVMSKAATALRDDEERTRNGRILVVDGDEGLARALAGILRGDGYAAATVPALEDALRQLREQPFDVLLADLRLEENGAELLARAHEAAPRVAVVVLTRVATFESALRALRAGATDYLVKPVDIDELRITIERGLEHARLERELADHVRELETAHEQVREFNEQLQQQVERATAELRSKVAALDDANHQLRQEQEDHDRFVAMVAHELRGPLNLIINYSHMLKRPNATPEQLGQWADSVIESAYRLNRLVDDLQTATRLRTGHFTLARKLCDVAATVEQVIDSFTSTVRNRRFALERPTGPLLAEVDADRVMQAVRNLIDNAVKYSAEDGAVEVRVWQDAERAYIRVRDYGAGIPESEMARIFEAYARASTQPDVSGTGLGLFITRGIVEMHGGELTVRNGTGTERARGAVFTIALPLHATQLPDEEDRPEQDNTESR